MYTTPLKEFSRTDYFDKTQISDDMADYSFDYFFYGKGLGKRKDLIDLIVVSWVMDDAENLFIRYCTYSGDRYSWKNKILEQLKMLMQDIDVSKEIINGRLRFYEVDSKRYLETEAFEKKFLELKSKMKMSKNY